MAACKYSSFRTSSSHHEKATISTLLPSSTSLAIVPPAPISASSV